VKVSKNWFGAFAGLSRFADFETKGRREMSTSGEVCLESISEFQLKELFKSRKFNADLRAVSGKRVEISQLGEPNLDAGPDFTYSLVKINGITIRGDIELHRRSSDWYLHSHNSDRNYNGVVLHLVVKCDDDRLCLTESGRRIETIELSRFLTSDAVTFLARIDSGEKILQLKCADENSKMPLRDKIDYLEFLGVKRFLHKVNKFEERLKDIIDENRPVVFEAKQKYFRDFSELLIEHKTYEKSELQDETYWDQLLYESICEGLGYSKNTSAFRKLSRNVPLSFLLEESSGNQKVAEAILFGVANLLPTNKKGFDDESLTYCEGLERIWGGIQKKYRREYVDKSEWLFFKLRPQNFPTLRIAGASRFFTGGRHKFAAKELEQSATAKNDEAYLSHWKEVLIVPAEDYWSRHFVFGTPSTGAVRMLIGAARAREIIVNAILPLTYLRGKMFELSMVQEKAMDIYKVHSPMVDNNITLLVKEYLFGGDNVFETVLAQQGAIHLYRSFCSEKRCERCKIGKMIVRKPAS
jgi:hypothetical protein